MFWMPKNTSKFFVIAREAENSTVAYGGSPGSLSPGTAPLFRSSFYWRPKNSTLPESDARRGFVYDTCTEPRFCGTCGRNLPTSAGFAPHSLTFALFKTHTAPTRHAV